MYTVSDAFNAAIVNGSEQRIWIRMEDGTFLDGSDVHQNGISLSEQMNPEENLTIGSCASSEFKAYLLNDLGLLNGYTFGEATVLLGVNVSETSNPYAGTLTTVIHYGQSDAVTVQGFLSQPYLKVNGSASQYAPPFPVYSLIASGLNLYAISVQGDVWQAVWQADVGQLVPLTKGSTWNDLSQSTWDEVSTTTWASYSPYMEITPFMQNKAAAYAAKGRALSVADNTVYEFGTTVAQFEYVPLGVFEIEKPSQTHDSIIEINAFDRMSLFDVNADEFVSNISYPTTPASMLAGLCDYVGIPLATVSFINSTRTIAQAPAQFEELTCREFLKWIAEMACACARMTRDGELELAWFGNAGFTISESNLYSAQVSEYEVAVIDKLKIMGATDDVGVIIGDGVNGYTILDNPLLYGDSDSQVRAYGVPIYNRLNAFAAYTPLVVTTVTGGANWAVQAGDILTVQTLEGTYLMPIFIQTIYWSSAASAVYENAGDPYRPVLSETNRRIWAQDRAMYVLQTSVDGLNSEVSKKVGDDEIISRINQSAESITIEASKINLNGAITANQYFKINLDGSIESIAGQIGGFSIGQDELSGNNGFVLNASAGSIQFQNGTISTVAGILQLINVSSGILLNASSVQLGTGSSQVNVLGTLTVNGNPISPALGGRGSCTYQWSSIPGASTLGTGYAIVASDAGSTGYLIKTRYNGGWQWCIDGASGSTTASWIAVST